MPSLQFLRPRPGLLRAPRAAAIATSAGDHRASASPSRWRSRRPRPPPTTHEPAAPATPAPAPAPAVLSLPPSYTLREKEVHCLVGLNGSGKSRLLRRLQQSASAPTAADSAWDATTSSPRRPPRLGTLSFDAHRAFVQEHGPRIVANVLGGIGSPDARDLIVRLGLFPVWESEVRHLSTGEIRKVMLARALLDVPRPTVLLLDQPFDGLDAHARGQLEWMLGQLTRGFTRLLVDTGGRNAAWAYRTQVILVANRLENIHPEILSHVALTSKINGDSLQLIESDWVDSENPGTVLTSVERFFQEEAQASLHEHARPDIADEQLVEWVHHLYDGIVGDSPTRTAIEIRGLTVAYGRRELLRDVHFLRQWDQHWALLGPNGSGKSSLMRVLMQSEGNGQQGGSVQVRGKRVAAISTDQHLEMLASPDVHNRSASEWLQATADQHNGGDTSDVSTIIDLTIKLLGLDPRILSRPFRDLSQGEQKLVQIGCALCQRPDVLILDEITHGLDVWNRQRVLRVIDTIGRHAADKTHLILITHHEDEIVGCFTDVYRISNHQLTSISPGGGGTYAE